MAGRRHHSVCLENVAGYGIWNQDRSTRSTYRLYAQDYALFPTYTVAGNIAYGLSHLSTQDRRKRVDEMLDLFQLRGFESAMPRELSGGQQQRVALSPSGRAATAVAALG